MSGRCRQLPLLTDVFRSSNSARRISSNAPIQGSGADIVVEAMIRLHTHGRLREIGYRLIMQVHDELILEGPEDHAEEALEITRDCMEHPFRDGADLLVPLPVDAAILHTWGE